MSNKLQPGDQVRYKDGDTIRKILPSATYTVVGENWTKNEKVDLKINSRVGPDLKVTPSVEPERLEKVMT